MAVYSMTGYASGQSTGPGDTSQTEEKAAASARIGVEIRSVNGRFLDLSFKLPDEARPYESELRELLSGRLKRGKVEMRVSLQDASRTGIAEPSVRLLQRLNGAQDAIRAWLPDAGPLSVAEVIRLAESGQNPMGDSHHALLALTRDVVDQLLEARRREGERLAATLRECVAQLRALVEKATPLVPQLVAQQRARFLERWQEAMGLTENAPPESAQERAMSEATAFAIRIDVAEELVRLRSHLDEIARLLDQGAEVGKRLDFLIQELHREANTLGSKSAALEMTHIGVDMKVLIEQMREQVQNIE